MVVIDVRYRMHLPLGKNSIVDVLEVFLVTRMTYDQPSTEAVFVVPGSITACNEHGDCDVHWGGGRTHNIFFLDPHEATLVKNSVTEVEVGVIRVSRDKMRQRTIGATEETMPDHWKIWGIRLPGTDKWLLNFSGNNRPVHVSVG